MGFRNSKKGLILCSVFFVESYQIEEEEHRIPGERAETVTGRRIDQNPVLKRGAVALAVVAFIGFALWSTTGKKAQDEDSQPERVVIRQTTPFEADASTFSVAPDGPFAVMMHWPLSA